MPLYLNGKKAVYPSTLVERRQVWAPLREAVLSILGTTGTIIPIGDSQHEAADRTTCTTVGAEQVVFTYSEALTAFDSPPSTLGPAYIPIVHFNGTDEEADTPDAAYWTRASAAWSAGFWIKPDDVTNGQTLLSKYDITTGATAREWNCAIEGTTGSPAIWVYDESVPAWIGRRDATALTVGVWQHLVFVDAGTDAATGLDVYLNGVAVDDTDSSSGIFVAMEDTACLVRLGHTKGAAAITELYNGAMAGGPLGPWFSQVAVTADVVKRLYQLGRTQIDV